ncbi:unnamed protein product [Rodentolepis nana]|uniref:Tetraspanin n=1 Tax=Rodentolepis nana TaxID=102285 RepID=A0A3P7SH58_RODNA|nr:unnamed protein product [Rodentolepis nana]
MCFYHQSKLIGFAVFTMSVLISLNKANTPEILGNYLFNVGSYVSLFCSTFLLLLPVWGSIALKRYSVLMLILYIIGITILILITFCGGVALLAFPAPLGTAVRTEMNRTLFRDYGKKGFITDAWDFMQSQLRCCAVDDNGWTAYRSSWWDLSVNAYFYNVSSLLSDTSSFYKRVPESCCLTLIDPLTGHPTGQFKSIEQCQGWQYGPPRFFVGAHNDAVYYRGCFSAIKSYLKRYSIPVGSLTLIASVLLSYLFYDIEIYQKAKEGFTSEA